RYFLPPPRAACRMVADVDELRMALVRREGGGGTAETSFSLPESARVIVGTGAEADALAWVAGKHGWPMVRGVVAAETSPDGGLRVTHTVHAGRFRRAVEIADEGAPVVLIVPTGLRTPAQRERAAALLAQEHPLLGERVSMDRHEGAAGRPDLGTARVVVAGGRPLRDAETFERLAGGLADVLGGAAAASGGAVNAGIAPSWMLIGQTGRTVAPDLYVALGISGSDQHVAGMQGAKTIVAVNTDADAPIFRVADFGLAADLHSVVPEWIAKEK
ncbi:MAG TPA: FAD-binding protein, partial [Armatimonadaceae bacterium]|nr:FAD-binding protein [Armatimonadaceae bacterium]